MTQDDDEFAEIKTGNGIDRDLAATGNDRQKKNIIEIRGLKGAIGTLNENLVRFTDSSDRYSKKLIYLTWALVALTIILVGLTVFMVKDAREQTSSQNSIALNSMFFTSTNSRIVDALENGNKILSDNAGTFTSGQLDNYLGTFDVIQSQYEKGL